jgi:hypothetical protein
MVSSGGGGSGKAPDQPTPSGTITGYGSSTPFNPSYNSVLSNGMGWADVDEVDAANAAHATATIPTTTASTGSSGGSNSDAFAQKLLDYQKQQRYGQMMLGMGPQGMVEGFKALQTQAPVATTPTEQLMLQALQSRSRPGGGGQSRMQSSR